MNKPSVLFVCVKNGGKSQIAAALMRKLGGVDVASAGTRPGSVVNEEAAAAVAELGASMAGMTPRVLDPAEVAGVDRVVVLGTEAVVEPVAGMRGRIETWITDEPSSRGIEGMERMRLVVADIAPRVETLHKELTGRRGPQIRVLEPALCRNTGVCGTDVHEALVAFTADARSLAALDAIRPLVARGEQFAIGAKAAYLLCPGGILKSKAGEALLGKAGRNATTRNWATVLKLQALASERPRTPVGQRRAHPR